MVLFLSFLNSLSFKKAYHSQFNETKTKIICGFPMLPLKGKAFIEDDEDDIVEEGIKYFRMNVLFKNYEILGIYYSI